MAAPLSLLIFHHKMIKKVFSERKCKKWNDI